VASATSLPCALTTSASAIAIVRPACRTRPCASSSRPSGFTERTKLTLRMRSLDRAVVAALPRRADPAHVGPGSPTSPAQYPACAQVRSCRVMARVEPIALEPVDALTITTLVDNLTDILLVDEGPAVRPRMGSGPRVPAAALEGGEAFDALRAEHGFAALVTFSRGGREHRVLFDTGISPNSGRRLPDTEFSLKLAGAVPRAASKETTRLPGPSSDDLATDLA